MPSPPPETRSRRLLELVLAGLTLLLALGLTAIAVAGLYRIGEWLLRSRSRPDSFTLILLTVVAAVACGLWLLAIRLFRGAGPRDANGKLLGSFGLRVAAVFFLLAAIFISWIVFQAGEYWPLSIAVVCLALMVLALRRAQAVSS